ncbi:MAG: type II toxin-antitoxin system HicA family toxin [Verrucomicrobiota bacterium]
MKLPRDLGGVKLAKTLCRKWGYVKVHQTGSHIILETETPSHQRIAIPAHKSLKIGTLNGILRSVAEHKATSRERILDTV